MKQQEQLDAAMMGIVGSMKKSYEDLGYTFVTREIVVKMILNLKGHIDSIYREMGTCDDDGIMLAYDNKSTFMVGSIYDDHKLFIVDRDYNDDTWSLETSVYIGDKNIYCKILIHLEDMESVVRSVIFGEPIDDSLVQKNNPKMRESKWAEDISDVSIVCVDD